MKKVDIANDFSPFLGLRKRKVSSFSGEEFRDDVLIPALNNLDPNEPLEIILDGTKGFGSSFLEEVFGGCIRKGINPELLKRIKFISKDDPSIIEEISVYIEDAIKGI